MSYQPQDEISSSVSSTEAELKRTKAQFDTVIAALEDVLSVFRSGGSAEIKLMRIEDLLSSAVSDAANLN
jgi:hypothetical protein